MYLLVAPNYALVNLTMRQKYSAVLRLQVWGRRINGEKHIQNISQLKYIIKKEKLLYDLDLYINNITDGFLSQQNIKACCAAAITVISFYVFIILASFSSTLISYQLKTTLFNF